MSKIKILVINTTGLRRDGITQVIFDYYSRFDMNKFEVHLLSGTEDPVELQEKFELSKIKVHVLNQRKNHLIKYFIDIFKLCRREKFQIIHVNGNSATIAIELLVGKLCGIPCRISHSHNSMCYAQKADKLLRPLFYKLYTEAFACGKEAGNWLYKNRNFHIIKNGRNIKQYKFNSEKRNKMRLELGIDQNTLVIGNVGNLNIQKNHKFVLEVFERLKNLRNNVKLFIMGYGKLYDDLKNKADELHISDDVIFTGTIDNVPDMLQAMDVMILPSLHEGLPLVVVEWQIAALPCLLSNVITRECSYSDLVHYMSLKTEPELWAKKLIEIADINRCEYSEKMIQLTNDNGYNIEENVIKLQNFYFNMLEKIN